jgi:hypothetical protein
MQGNRERKEAVHPVSNRETEMKETLLEDEANRKETFCFSTKYF